jgi:ribosomal protein S18 acetylase RimI-like enzyme
MVTTIEDPPHAEISFRRLSVDDADVISGIADSAFGTSGDRGAEIRRYLTLEPNYWLLATYRDQPAGVVGATDYGRFAFLGVMTVRRELQGKGIGSALFRHELQWLEEEGVSFLRLEASDTGFPIYLRHGFEVVDRSVMLHLPSLTRFSAFPGNVRPLEASDLEELAAFDAPVFGARRSGLFRALLQDFPGRAFASHDGSGGMTGFLFAQPRRLGPWVARDPEHAESLLRAALTLSFEGPPLAIAPQSNQGALALLERYGFTRGRVNRHMRRGALTQPGDRSVVYGLTSFAVG